MRVTRAVRSHRGSSWLTRSAVGLALATLCHASLATPVAAEDDAANRRAVIAPGEERLIAAMLGKAKRVRRCKLSSGGVEYTTIKATYECPDGPVSLELTHPQSTTDESIQTERFAMTLLSGSPPKGFQEALLSRIRPREGQFAWTWAEDAAVQDDASN
jgi:hypothetical protein